jgi:hypothetical protein
MSSEKGAATEELDVRMVIRIGFDVLNILADRFRKEMGRQFDEAWEDSLSELKGFAKVLFEDVRAGRESREINITVVNTRYQAMEGEKDGTMILDAFTEIIDRMIASTRRYLGEGPVRDALQEAVRLLSVVKKYQPDRVITETFLRRIQEGP